jgi:RhoGAP domain
LNGKAPVSKDVWTRVSFAMNHVENIGGLTSEGIYRTSGLGKEVEKIKQFLSEGNATSAEIVKLFPNQIHEWACGIKSCLRDFAPLTSYQLFQAFMNANLASHQYAGTSDSHSQTTDDEIFQLVLSSLSHDDLERLSEACHHLLRIAEASPINRMTASNLAKIWGPILFRPDESTAKDLKYELTLAGQQYALTMKLLHVLGSDELDNVVASSPLTSPRPTMEPPRAGAVAAEAAAASTNIPQRPLPLRAPSTEGSSDQSRVPSSGGRFDPAALLALQQAAAATSLAAASPEPASPDALVAEQSVSSRHTGPQRSTSARRVDGSSVSSGAVVVAEQEGGDEDVDEDGIDREADPGVAVSSLSSPSSSSALSPSLLATPSRSSLESTSSIFSATSGSAPKRTHTPKVRQKMLAEIRSLPSSSKTNS